MSSLTRILIQSIERLPSLRHCKFTSSAEGSVCDKVSERVSHHGTGVWEINKRYKVVGKSKDSNSRRYKREKKDNFYKRYRIAKPLK